MPGLSRHSLHAAALFGDLDEVKRRLALEPDAAKQKGGPLDWEPILYLAYGRLPGADVHAAEIARFCSIMAPIPQRGSSTIGTIPSRC
jgi:hypothetical protein